MLNQIWPIILICVMLPLCATPERATENSFVRFYQRDPRWADVPFGSFTVASGGCGPAAVAMAASTLWGREVWPCYVARWGRGFYVSGVGSSHSLFTSESTHAHFGLNFRAIPTSNEAEVLAALRDGAVIITSVQSRNSPNARDGATGMFTIVPNGHGGHIALLYGATDCGNVFVYSPLREDFGDNGVVWPLSTVIREMHRGVGVFWVYTADKSAAPVFGCCHLSE